MNGLLYDAVNAIAERRVRGAIRSALIPPLRGCVIEVGAGTGASFPYYDPSVHVLVIEPDRSMAKRAEMRAAQARADIDILDSTDLALDDLPVESADHVIAMLVLCSVNDPPGTLARIRSVLKPGGTYVFIEHVRGCGMIAHVQDVLTPAWKRLFGNCHLNRPIVPAFEQAGFIITDLCTSLFLSLCGGSYTGLRRRLEPPNWS